MCTSSREQTITGNPDPEHPSTNFLERSNLTIRMSITRLTNAFPQKLDNHKRRWRSGSRPRWRLGWRIMFGRSPRSPSFQAETLPHNEKC